MERLTFPRELPRRGPKPLKLSTLFLFLLLGSLLAWTVPVQASSGDTALAAGTLSRPTPWSFANNTEGSYVVIFKLNSCFSDHSRLLFNPGTAIGLEYREGRQWRWRLQCVHLVHRLEWDW